MGTSISISKSSLKGEHALIKLSPNTSIFPSLSSSATTSTAASANRLLALPFIPNQTFTCSELYVNCTAVVASSLARILIYSDLNGKPYEKLYESANLDTSTLGKKTVLTNFTFNAGETYWLTTHNSSTPTYSAIQTSSLIPVYVSSTNIVNVGYLGVATFGAAPSIFLVSLPSNTTLPCVFITAL